MKLLIFFVSLMAALSAPAVDAPLAADGFDPVLLAGGEEQVGNSVLTVVYGGHSYRFASTETRAAFEKAPETYLESESRD